MVKIDCIQEMLQEEYNAGYEEGRIEASEMIAKNFISKGFDLQLISKYTDLSLDKIKELKREIKFSK